MITISDRRRDIASRATRMTGALAAAGFTLLLATAGSARAEPQKYVLDPSHLSIGFLVTHAGYEKVLGMFRKASGEIMYDRDTKTLSSGKIVVQTDSVFTNQEERDKHLRSPDFLNSREFPEMTFTLTGSKATGDKTGTITGELELLGEKRPITLNVTLNKAEKYPFTNGLFSGHPFVLGVSARGSFKRSDFGMTYGVEQDWVGDNVEMIIEFEAEHEE